jgi:hypothetical protein
MEDQMTAGLIGFLKKPQRTRSSQERTMKEPAVPFVGGFYI